MIEERNQRISPNDLIIAIVDEDANVNEDTSPYPMTLNDKNANELESYTKMKTNQLPDQRVKKLVSHTLNKTSNALSDQKQQVLEAKLSEKFKELEKTVVTVRK